MHSRLEGTLEDRCTWDVSMYKCGRGVEDRAHITKRPDRPPPVRPPAAVISSRVFLSPACDHEHTARHQDNDGEPGRTADAAVVGGEALAAADRQATRSGARKTDPPQPTSHAGPAPLPGTSPRDASAGRGRAACGAWRSVGGCGSSRRLLCLPSSPPCDPSLAPACLHLPARPAPLSGGSAAETTLRGALREARRGTGRRRRLLRPPPPPPCSRRDAEASPSSGVAWR
eukprot:364536-Chlamydomonas_euryale.AAC.12